MLGFLVGFGCLMGLIAVLKGGHRRGRCGGRGWHGGGGWRGRHGRGGPGFAEDDDGGGGGPRRGLRFLYRKLDTTRGQEKELSAAFDGLLEAGKALRPEAKRTRDDVAALLRTESLDEDVLGGLMARHDEKLREAHKAFADALTKVHLALEPAQREQLAAWVESGRGPSFGPYRSRG